ncbi:MAG: hypothetical protein RIQ68_1667 [Pseudomonadota bacterium]
MRSAEVEIGRITATCGRLIGYLGWNYSVKGLVFRMGIAAAIVKARVGAVLAWLGLPKRLARAPFAPHFVMI